MTAIHAAETGHLVFGTIHASSALDTIGRILDLFPARHAPGPAQRHRLQHEGHRRSEAAALDQAGRGPRADGRDHDLQPDVRKLILEEQDDKLADAIRICEQDGMQDFTMSLKDLVDKDLIDRASGFRSGAERGALKMALKGIEVKHPGIL